MAEADAGSLLEREDIGDVTVVRINVRSLLHDETTEDVFRRIASVLDEPGRRKLVLNFRTIEFFSSAAQGQLVTVYRKVQAAGGRLVLCNVTPTVAGVLQVTRLADILLAYADEREALRAMA
jgi:anti-anti-sigma factor